jgi:hypothetical protein
LFIFVIIFLFPSVTHFLSFLIHSLRFSLSVFRARFSGLCVGSQKRDVSGFQRKSNVFRKILALSFTQLFNCFITVYSILIEIMQHVNIQSLNVITKICGHLLQGDWRIHFRCLYLVY